MKSSKILEDYNNDPSKRSDILPLYLTLAAAEGLLVSLLIVLQPSEAGSRFLLGLSLQRLVMLGAIIAGTLGWALLAALSVRRARWREWIGEKIIQPERVFFCLMGLAEIILLVGTASVVFFSLKTPAGWSAYASRLAPFGLWVMALALQTIILLPGQHFQTGTIAGVARYFKQRFTGWSLDVQIERPLPAKPSRLMRATVILALIFLLMPSSNLSRFDGFPLSSLPEYILLALLLPLLFSPELAAEIENLFLGRRRISDLTGLKTDPQGHNGGRGISNLSHKGRQRKPDLTDLKTDPQGHTGRRWLLGAGVGILLLAVLLKLLLFASQAESGFQACYYSPVQAPSTGSCEMSYENPFFVKGATRFDDHLDFSPANWNLNFFNDDHYSFYSEKPGSYLRERIPFQAGWEGMISAPTGSMLLVNYTGEGTLVVAGKTIDLPNAYARSREIKVPAPGGESRFALLYFYDDGSRVGSQHNSALPALQVRLISAQGDDLGLLNSRNFSWDMPPAYASLAPLLPVAAGMVDFTGWALLLALATAFIVLIRDSIALLLLASATGLIIYMNLPELWMIAPVALLAVLIHTRKRPHALPAAYVGLLFISYLRAAVFLHNPDFVFYRIPGADPLTYESFGRAILTSGSLQAGEKIFFYQPFYRYLVYLFHILFGDGDLLHSALVLALTNLGVFAIYGRIATKQEDRYSGVRQALVLLALLFTLGFINSNVVFLFEDGMAEYPTWPMLIWLVYLLLADKPERAAIPAAVLVGFIAITRYNYLPGLALLFALFLIPMARKSPKQAILAMAVFAAVMLLPVLHNRIYGGKWIWIPTSAGIQSNLIFPPQSLFPALFTHHSMQTLFFTQLRFLAGWVGKQFLDVSIAMNGLLALWLIAIFIVLRQYKRMDWQSGILLLTPLAFLGTQLFFRLLPAYPRHVVIGYIAMGLACMVSLARPRTSAPKSL